MSNVSKKLARTAAFGLWSIASVALAGQGKSNAPACYEGGKAVATAKTQEECQKLGEKFTWMEAHEHGKDHGKAQAKGQGKVKAKTEAKVEKAVAAPAPTTPDIQTETQVTPVTEAPKK